MRPKPNVSSSKSSSESRFQLVHTSRKKAVSTSVLTSIERPPPDMSSSKSSSESWFRPLYTSRSALRSKNRFQQTPSGYVKCRQKPAYEKSAKHSRNLAQFGSFSKIIPEFGSRWKTTGISFPAHHSSRRRSRRRLSTKSKSCATLRKTGSKRHPPVRFFAAQAAFQTKTSRRKFRNLGFFLSRRRRVGLDVPKGAASSERVHLKAVALVALLTSVLVCQLGHHRHILRPSHGLQEEADLVAQAVLGQEEDEVRGNASPLLQEQDPELR